MINVPFRYMSPDGEVGIDDQLLDRTMRIKEQLQAMVEIDLRLLGDPCLACGLPRADHSFYVRSGEHHVAYGPNVYTACKEWEWF